MTNQEYIKAQADSLPEAILAKIREFIHFQKFSHNLFENDTDSLVKETEFGRLMKKAGQDRNFIRRTAQCQKDFEYVDSEGLSQW
ncbi:MAG: hypothetical protein LBE35_03520 [Clostridiales bacterium]|jgi:hypothetical protein|nr:hypothetical protein [Clostridiales bacterium]